MHKTTTQLGLEGIELFKGCQKVFFKVSKQLPSEDPKSLMGLGFLHKKILKASWIQEISGPSSTS